MALKDDWKKLGKDFKEIGSDLKESKIEGKNIASLGKHFGKALCRGPRQNKSCGIRL